jgi:diphosphomevalonate decarboxylase
VNRGSCTAMAGTNIALIKYWGKRNAALNLPAAGSLSLTLNELGTRTTVRFGADLGAEDRIELNGADPDPATRAKIVAFLDVVRAEARLAARAEVVTENTVPTAGGLASSASGFAALALAASRAAGLALAPAQLSALARRGSGSAARSIFGGFVEMRPGTLSDGTDAVAVPVPLGDGWAVRLAIAVTAEGKKAIPSTTAMERTARTSPYYHAWLQSVPLDLREALAAIAERDLARLGAVSERNALRMHATAIAADPPIVYWTPATLAAMQTVHALRAGGIPAYFTIDAGPHVKVLCRADDAANVAAALDATPGVLRTLVATPGRGAYVLQETTV